MYLIPRRGFGRMFALLVIVISVLLCLYYVSHIQTTPNAEIPNEDKEAPLVFNDDNFDEVRQQSSTLRQLPQYSPVETASKIFSAMCPRITPVRADIDTQVEFDKFDFQVGVLYMFCFFQKS